MEIMNTIGSPPERSPVDAEYAPYREDEEYDVENKYFDVSRSTLNENWMSVPEGMAKRSGLRWFGLFSSRGGHGGDFEALQPTYPNAYVRNTSQVKAVRNVMLVQGGSCS
jgi:hypothetical protein